MAKTFMTRWEVTVVKKTIVWADPSCSEDDILESVEETECDDMCGVNGTRTFTAKPVSETSDVESMTCITQDEGWLFLEGMEDDNGDPLDPTADIDTPGCIQPALGSAYYQRGCEEAGQGRLPL